MQTWLYWQKYSVLHYTGTEKSKCFNNISYSPWHNTWFSPWLPVCLESLGKLIQKTHSWFSSNISGCIRICRHLLSLSCNCVILHRVSRFTYPEWVQIRMATFPLCQRLSFQKIKSLGNLFFAFQHGPVYVSGRKFTGFPPNEEDNSEAKLLSIVVGFRVYLMECNICSDFLKGPVNCHSIEP